MEATREEAGRADPKPSLIPLPPAFINDAGAIQNLVTGPAMRCVSIIRSRAGSVRSRHYHLTDAHWLYVLSGEMVYYERQIDGEYGEGKKVPQGAMVYTGPLLVHRTEFPVDTVLISMSKNPRDTESHESDLVRVDD